MAADKGRSDKDRDDEDDDDDDDAPEAKGSEKDRRHASTEGVAKALGVDEDEEDAAADGEAGEGEGDDKPAPMNRAARRRADAIRRRDARRGVQASDADDEANDEANDDDDEEEAPKAKAKKRASSDDEESDDEDEKAASDDDEDEDEKPKKKSSKPSSKTKAAPLPKDKNARAKELLRRRREALEKKQDIGLSAGEVVQDQLARAAAGTGRWFTRHFRKIVAALVLGVAGATAFILYTDHVAEKAGASSDSIMKGVMAESGLVFEGETKDTRSDVEKARDPRPVFTSQAARAETVVAAYQATAAEQKGTGIGILATLGLAGSHLQASKWDEAIAKYDEVLGSPLAKADVDVRARSLEGKGLALEGKKDYEGALKQFTDLEGVDKSFEDLARYQQARMYAAKGDKAKAKELLVALEKKLQVPTLEGLQQQHLRTLANEALRAIDPSAAPKKSPFGGLDGRISPEDIQRLMEQQRQMGGGDEHGEH